MIYTTDANSIQEPLDALRLPSQDLLKYLVKNLEIFATARTGASSFSVKQFRHGQSNPTYLIQYNNINCVLRKKPPGKILRGAHSIEREAEVLQALSRCGYPSPRCIHVCHDNSIIGTSFYIMGVVDGVIYKNPRLPTLRNSDRKNIYIAMVTNLARLHTIKPKEIGLHSFGNAYNYCRRQIKVWGSQYQQSVQSTGYRVEAVEKLSHWLLLHIPRLSTIYFDIYSKVYIRKKIITT